MLFAVKNSIFSAHKYDTFPIETGCFRRGNNLFLPWKRHGNAVQENFLHRAEMFLAPCGYGITSVLI